MNTRPLSKDFYSFIIFFLSILTIASLIQSIALLGIGSKVLTMGSFYPWSWLFIALVIVTYGAMIRYFFHHGYRVAAITCLILFLPATLQYAMILNVEIRVQFQQYYQAISYCMFATTALFGLSLLFTNAREKRWLRLSGILMVLFPLLQTVFFIFILIRETVVQSW